MQMKPFLSILTRCFKRPKQLEHCIASVQNQTDRDVEHLFISDDVGRGLLWANSQIYENRHRVNGEWVYVLDDDDHLIFNGFVAELKSIVEQHNPDIVICKGYINERIYPIPGFWNLPPIRGTLGSPNFIVKKQLFMRHAQSWCKDKAGDYFFIKQAFSYGKAFWWDKFVFNAPVSCGRPEEATDTQRDFFEMQEEYDRDKNTLHA